MDADEHRWGRNFLPRNTRNTQRGPEEIGNFLTTEYAEYTEMKLHGAGILTGGNGDNGAGRERKNPDAFTTEYPPSSKALWRTGAELASQARLNMGAPNEITALRNEVTEAKNRTWAGILTGDHRERRGGSNYLLNGGIGQI